MLFKMKDKIPFKKVFAYLGSGLMVLTLFFAMPVSAESGALSAPFVGFNVHIMDIDAEYKYIDGGNWFIDGSHQGGTIQGQLNCSSPSSAANSTNSCDIYELENQQGTQTGTGGLSIKFNGSATFQNITNDEFTGTIYKRIYEIEFVLDDSYVGYVTFQANSQTYTSYVNGTSFHQNFWSDAAESFSISITNYSLNRNVNSQWNIPNESIISIMGLFQTGFTLYSYNGNDIHIPIFVEDSTKNINNTSVTPTQKKCLVVLYTNHSVYNISTFNQWFTYNSNFECSKISYTQRGQSGWIVQAEFTNNSDSSQTLGLKSVSNSGRFTLIYSSLVYDSYPVSNEFALQFGLTNDYLNAVVYGTTSTNQSASQTNQENSNLQDSQNDLFTQEDSFNDSMNNSLNNINPNFNIGTNFGSKFINSADWVKTQFDRVTGNTPFGSVLGFSLLLGVSLLIIGKVFG